MRRFTDEETLERVESLPTFKGWKIGVYDIWMRSKEDRPNEFDDKVFTYECVIDGKRPKFIMKCSGTSNAGLTGLLNFDTYNKLGCAVLKADHMVYESHNYGPHKKYMAYKQAKGFDYCRDNDKDNKAEEIGKVYSDIIGANCHHAGVFSTIINDWSLACLVRNVLKEFDQWMHFMNKRPLTVVILKEF